MYLKFVLRYSVLKRQSLFSFETKVKVRAGIREPYLYHVSRKLNHFYIYTHRFYIYRHRRYNVGRRSSKDSGQEGDLPDNAGVVDAAQMGRVQCRGIFCAIHYDRAVRRGRKIKETAVIAWPRILRSVRSRLLPPVS